LAFWDNKGAAPDIIDRAEELVVAVLPVNPEDDVEKMFTFIGAEK